MSAVARALVCGMALALIAGAQAPPASAQPRRDVRIAFETEDGLLRLEVFSAPGAFVVDPHALRFTLRAFRGFRPDAAAIAQPIRVDVGPPVAVPNAATRPAYRIGITVAGPPRPGMYELSADALPGFARTADGEELPLSRFPSAGIGAIAAWWPDERNDDPGLRDVRARFAHRVVHGFGGLPLSCPSFGTQYPPETGVHVGAVTREVGHVELVQPGSTWGSDVGPTFLAFDPLALRVLDPPPPPQLPSPLPAPTPCEIALHYADPWHVDTKITTSAPPRFAPANGFPVRPGMLRDEVVWREGYPNEFGGAALLRAENTWRYVSPTPLSWSVTFAHDCVVHVDPPGQLP